MSTKCRHAPYLLEPDTTLRLLLPLLIHYIALVLAAYLILLVGLLRFFGLFLLGCFKTFLCTFLQPRKFLRPVTALFPLICDTLFYTRLSSLLHYLFLPRCCLRCFFSTHLLELLALFRRQHSRRNSCWPSFSVCFLCP